MILLLAGLSSVLAFSRAQDWLCSGPIDFRGVRCDPSGGDQRIGYTYDGDNDACISVFACPGRGNYHPSLVECKDRCQGRGPEGRALGVRVRARDACAGHLCPSCTLCQTNSLGHPRCVADENCCPDGQIARDCLASPDCRELKSVCDSIRLCVVTGCGDRCQTRLYTDLLDEIPVEACVPAKTADPCEGVICGPCERCVPVFDPDGTLRQECKELSDCRAFDLCRVTECRVDEECHMLGGLPTCVPSGVLEPPLRPVRRREPVRAVELPIPFECGQPIEPGRKCSAGVTAFAYDPHSGTCRPFLFGGCGGSLNRFKSREWCERVCIHRRGSPPSPPPPPLSPRVETEGCRVRGGCPTPSPPATAARLPHPGLVLESARTHVVVKRSSPGITCGF